MRSSRQREAFPQLIVVGSSTGAHAGPWCAFYDSSTYNCGAVGPVSPVGQDASACPLLRACAASRIALHWSLAAGGPHRRAE